MKIAFITLGCKVNQYETQAMENLLCRSGHALVAPEEAEIVVVNTCSVTAESARKSRQAARKAHRLNPSARLVVCGCYAEGDPDGATIGGEADYVGGVRSRRDIVAYIDRIRINETNYTQTPENSEITGQHTGCAATTFEELPAGSYGGHARAYLKIQDGCDNFCAYCIIPHLRGRARSLTPERAVAEAVELAKRHREIVLTGIEITAYGKDIGTDLVTLVERVSDAVGGAARLRLGSLEPSYITDNVAARLGRLVGDGALCPHFHLSLQSGTAATLRRMRRKYTAEQFAGIVEKLRTVSADPSITTDLIVGFPGETDADFEETLRFLSRVGFASVHVFPYSRRPGTVADAMPGHLDTAVKRERASRAAAIAAETRAAYLAAQIGRVVNVLIEDERGLGTAENYIEVIVQASNGTFSRGDIVPVHITGIRADGVAEGAPCR